ncbi:MAG: DUF1570 domain-containing protein [Spirochaetales bacterium]|nr:DUF1570 domain-containing protein [Spirochaetales bacterium]
MKRTIFILLISILFAIPLFSQNLQMAESTNYRVYSELSKENAQFIATAMDQYFNLYNQYFHFDRNKLTSKLQIRLFKSKDGFDEYLSSIIPETSSSFVFLQYKNINKSELVVYLVDDIEKMTKMMIHHGFVQFLKTFIAEPPLWIQKGFAIYFEKSLYNSEDNTVIFRNNLDWAITLKKYISADRKDPLNQKLFSISELLSINNKTANKNINIFYAESWGLVNFLLNSKYKEYNRVIWDAVSAMKQDASKTENETAIVKSSFEWTDKNRFITDFYFYIDSLKTFNELVQDGIKLYAEGSLDEAERLFIKAMILDENNYIPYYYMGLINYGRKDYSMAEYYYHSTIDMGGNPDLGYYALGVNSYADSNQKDTLFYLSKVSAGEYKTKADELLATVRGETTETDPVSDTPEGETKDGQSKSGK